MKRISALTLGLTLMASIGFVGCAEETKVETEKKVETPTGSVTETDTKTIEKTGDAKTNP